MNFPLSLSGERGAARGRRGEGHTAPDLDLPDWGPYTKCYIGVSHIADARRGLRFDPSVFPGFYRRKIDVPDVLWESGYNLYHA